MGGVNVGFPRWAFYVAMETLVGGLITIVGGLDGSCLIVFACGVNSSSGRFQD